MALKELQDRIDWSRFGGVKDWRSQMNQRPGLVAGVTGVCLVLLLVVLFAYSCSGGPSAIAPRPQAYYYDLSDRVLFAGEPDWVPPVMTPNGEERGVRAYVYDCGMCGPTPRIAYVEIMKTPDEVQAMIAASGAPAAVNPDGLVKLVADPEDVDPEDPDGTLKFHLDTSEAGQKVLAEAYEPCPDGQKRVMCDPVPPRVPGM